jgi:hypothetical protein
MKGCQVNILGFLNPDFRPVRFYSYASLVTDRILEIPFNNFDDTNRSRAELVLLFHDAGITNACVDNKTVFEFLNVNTKTRVYVGFYDLRMTIGLGVYPK